MQLPLLLSEHRPGEVMSRDGNLPSTALGLLIAQLLIFAILVTALFLAANKNLRPLLLCVSEWMCLVSENRNALVQITQYCTKLYSVTGTKDMMVSSLMINETINISVYLYRHLGC